MSSAIADAQILVTGASGFVGGHLVRRLSGMGGRIRILCRRTSKLDALSDLTYDRFEGDLTDPLSLARASEGVDYVFHSGGLVSAPNDETYIAANGEGTKNACAAAKSAAPGLKRFVYISSMAAAGPGPQGKLIDEEMPAKPITPYGASKRLGEKWVQQFDIPWSIIRPPAVYGPWDKAVLPLFQMARWHVSAVVASRGMTSVVYVDNLVEGIIQSAVSPTSVGQTFYVADEPALTRADLARQMQAAVGTWAVPLPVPNWVVRSAARVSEAIAKGFGTSAFFDRHKATDLLTLNWACSIEHARRFLGYVPHVSTAEGFKRTADWYRRMGWL